MDINDLFGSGPVEPEKQPEKSQCNVFVSDSLEYLPLIYGLKLPELNSNFKLSYMPISVCAERLREGAADLALIPALDYGRRKEVWNLIPGIGVSTRGSLKNVQLFFKKGLKEINSVAVDPVAESEKALLQILMREKYMMNPKYISMDPDLDKMLGKADAALLSGSAALKYYLSNRNRLDLGEEWFDLTSLPYVSGFWAGRPFTVSKQQVAVIKKSFTLGQRNLEKISQAYAQDQPENWVFYHDFLSKDLSYQLSEDVIDGLMEFYNYAFFYGLIEHIPDLHYF